MKNKFLKITFILTICICFALGKDTYASSMTLSGSTSGSPNSTVNINVGGNFTGRVDVAVSNGDGSKSVWIENNIQTIQVKLGSSGITTVSASSEKGTSDEKGNEISPLSATPLSITIVQPSNNSSTITNTPTSSKASATNTSSTKNSTNTSSTKSSNAYLKTLQVNQEGLSPNFNKSKTNYSITIGQNVTSLKVTALAEDSTAKVLVTGNTGLKNGDNKIYATVTAQDGTKKVYTIIATKTADSVKSNSYLQSLIVENATLSPEFSKENLEYDCGKVGASVENLKILAFGENEKAKVDITGNDSLVEGENKITVKVTSEDGTTNKEYTIKVVKDSSIVEEEKVEEINPLQNTDNSIEKTSLAKNILNRIKANWLIVIMYAVILVEFVQIVYLYKQKNKKCKEDKSKVRDLNSTIKSEEIYENKFNKKNISLDKEFKLNKKRKKKIDKNYDTDLNEETGYSKRAGAKRFNSDDK